MAKVQSYQPEDHGEHTGSRQITVVKQRWARIVLGWQTAWELRVPLAFLLYYQTLIILPNTTFTFFEDLLWQPSGNKEHPWFRQMAGVLHRAP